MKRRSRQISWLGLLLAFIFPTQVWAAPYFYITGDDQLSYGDTNIYSVYLYTDSSTLTAAQTVISFDSTILSKVSYSTLSSRCSFWSPADPSLGYGNDATPYFYDNNKFVIACGFANPGYISTAGAGDLIAKFSVAEATANTSTTSFTFSNAQLRYIGNSVTAGASPSFSLETFAASSGATPTPLPPSPTSATDTLSLSDITFNEIGTANISMYPTYAYSSLNGLSGSRSASTIDNSIPKPPELTPRPSATPYSLPTNAPDQQNPTGDVLSIQSLRELLLPGKSNADQTVVLINLISTLTFLIILTILIWRLIVINRMNKIKQRHMKEMLSGELSVLETKVSSGQAKSDEVTERLEQLKEELEKRSQ